MKLKLDDDSNAPEIGHSETRSEIKLPQGLLVFLKSDQWSWSSIKTNCPSCG